MSDAISRQAMPATTCVGMLMRGVCSCGQHTPPHTLDSVWTQETVKAFAGRKYDDGKEPMVQGCLAYFGRALRAVAGISAYGSKKYNAPFSDQNWRKVDNAKGRYADALVRHLEAYSRGEMIDAESGKAHVDMVAWNALALSELEKGQNPHDPPCCGGDDCSECPR